jgi:hypothetical protein
LLISLEEALGLKPKAVTLEKEEAEEEYSEFDHKRVLRRKIIFERRARGDTDEEILHFLAQKGYSICRRTLQYDLKSDDVASLKDELVRSNLRDIAMLRGYALQDSKNPNLKALAEAIRAKNAMINNLMPKIEPNVNVEVNVANKTEHVLLTEYAGIISEAATLNGNFSKLRVGQSVDSSETSSGNGEERSNC